MELETLKQSIFRWIGWLSVVNGLLVLAIINISLLSGYNVPMAGSFSSLVIAGFVLSMIAIIPRQSRSLGSWGLFISIYIAVFGIVIFFLGWTITPFP